MLLEFRPCFDFGLIFSSFIILQMLILNRGRPFQPEGSQLKGLFFIMLFEFKDSFNGLHQIKIVLWVNFVIKFWCLNFEINTVIPWMSSSPSSSFLIIIVVTRGRVCDDNESNIITPIVRASLFEFPHLFKLPNELPYSLLKYNTVDISPYIMGLFKTDFHRVRSISLVSLNW